jgi:SAM-dependent methyltransferase
VKHGYEICDCLPCDHRFTQPGAVDTQHVNTVYSDDYFTGGGAGYSDYLAEEKLLRDRGRRYAQLLNQFTKPGRILDVGAAAGFVLQGFVDGGWTGSGVEPNETMASVARSRLGLEVWTGMMENLADDLQFDAVSMIQVLPHFIDPKRALAVAAKILRPGGVLLIETWNRKSWTAKITGQGWHEYSPPSVLHWFTPNGIIKLGAEFGLAPLKKGRPAKKIVASHAKSLMRHTLGDSLLGKVAKPMLGIIPDGLVLPYPAEDLFYLVMQKR